MIKKLFIFIVVILIFLIFGYFYSNLKKNSSTVNKLRNQKTNSKKVKEIEIIAKQWSFEPKEIKVKQNEFVRLRVKSVDVPHGLALPSFNVNLYLPEGEEKTVEFVADKKGEYLFFCSVLCGQGHDGMRGKLIVE